MWRTTVAVFCALLAQSDLSMVASSQARRRSVAPTQPCRPGVIATQSGVSDIAADPANLYFGEDSGRVHRVAKSGGPSTPLVTMSESWITFLAVDAIDVYFAARSRSTGLDSIYAVPKSGGTPRLLLSDVLSAWEMVPDGDWLYLLAVGNLSHMPWPADGRVVRIRKDGSAVETVAGNLRAPLGMVIDGESVYFTEAGANPADPAGGVRRVSKSGGTVATVAPLAGAWTLAQDAENLYAVDISRGERNGAIHSVSKRDGSIRQLATGIAFEVIEPVEVFNGSLYFMNLLGSTRAQIEALPVTGGDRRIVAEFDWGFPQFVIDGCGIYYSTPVGIERVGH